MSTQFSLLLLAILLSLLVVACAGEPGFEAHASAPPIEAELSHEGPVYVTLEVGQRVYLKARSIPIHPDYKEGRIRPEFDAESLALVNEEKDTGGYGFTGVRYLFEARSPGATEVRLVTYKGEEPDPARTSTYRVTVR